MGQTPPLMAQTPLVLQADLPPPMALGPPVMPMLHGVMIGQVQFMTPRGALLRLSDCSHVRYLDGLLKKRKETAEVRVGQKFFVKVVRIEPGLVVVDSRHVDAKTGQDTDPFNEKAEVEDWIDVPSGLVGHIIGKDGARIRAICEESGADLRFDEVTLSSPAQPSGTAGVGAAAASSESATKQVRRVGRSGGGEDLKHFLESARADAGDDGDDADRLKTESAPAGDDLRRFLEDAQANDGGTEEDGADDLRRFLAEARGDSPSRPAVVEFDAQDHASWEASLKERMEAAGITEVHMENLLITDKRGHTVDISGGLKQKHFPIHVRYEDKKPEDAVDTDEKPTADPEKKNIDVHPEDADDTDEKPTAEREEKKNDAKQQEKGSSSAARCAEAYLQHIEEEESAAAEPLRLEAVHVSGAERLTKKDIADVLEAKGLPELSKIEHITKDDVVCVFASSEDASLVLESLREGFEDVEVGQKEGPGLWRARNGYLKYRMARSSDVKETRVAKESAAAVETVEVMRLRVNGDAIEVAKARVTVLGLLSELLSRRAPFGARAGIDDGGIPRGPKLMPGEVREHVEIPSDKVGRVIGKGGANIKKLESDSGARLRVAPAGDLRDGDFQELSMQGPPAAIAKAKDLLERIIGAPPRSPRRRPAASPPRAATPVPQTTRAASAPPLPPPRVVRSLSPSRQARRQPLEPGDEGNEDKSEPGATPSQDSASMSSRTRRRRLRAKRQDMERLEVELYLKRQRQLDEAAAAAEAEAAALVAFASQQPEAEDASLAALCDSGLLEGVRDGPVDYEKHWVEVTDNCPHLELPALTPYGAGRVARAVSVRGEMYLTVRLLAGGSIQAPEVTALEWLEVVRQWLGTCVLRPTPGAPTPAADTPTRKSGSWVHDWEQMQARLIASGCGLVVHDVAEEGTRLVFNLVPRDGPSEPLRPTAISRSTARAVGAAELSTWPQVASVAYLVDLCTTPQTVGHVVLCRHDYRTTSSPFVKGDFVVIEGSKRRYRDMGVVRKVLADAKAERAALAATSSPNGATGAGHLLRLKRCLRKCSDEERLRREGPLASLEATALPLLAARLPKGAEALGVGASLDGEHMRLFVRLDGDGEASSGAAASASTAAAALGALLGCEAELLVSTRPPLENGASGHAPGATPDAAPGTGTTSQPRPEAGPEAIAVDVSGSAPSPLPLESKAQPLRCEDLQEGGESEGKKVDAVTAKPAKMVVKETRKDKKRKKQAKAEKQPSKKKNKKEKKVKKKKKRKRETTSSSSDSSSSSS